MTRANKWLEQRLDRLEEKMDKVQTETVPALLVEVAKIVTAGKIEARTETKIRDRIYGGIAIVVSVASLALAIYKS